MIQFMQTLRDVRDEADYQDRFPPGGFYSNYIKKHASFRTIIQTANQILSKYAKAAGFIEIYEQFGYNSLGYGFLYNLYERKIIYEGRTRSVYISEYDLRCYLTRFLTLYPMGLISVPDIEQTKGRDQTKEWVPDTIEETCDLLDIKKYLTLDYIKSVEVL